MSRTSSLFSFLFILVFFSSCLSLVRVNSKNLTAIQYEQDKNQSSTYEQTIAFYNSLDENSKYVQVNSFGKTDIGEPLHEVIIDRNKTFDPIATRNENRSVLFINNGIHAGESCGIDASMMLARDILVDKSLFTLLESTVIVIIPTYNVGGAKNRSKTSRANQNGPVEHGFRGNALNLDLNRDFIKADSKNAASFSKLFTKWSPDVLIDTHTSNGADYQHIITLINTQKDKLAPPLGTYLEVTLLPKIYDAMSQDGYDMSPYVYSIGKTPEEKGIMSFPDLPRYSSGYAALHHTISFMPETHMLKTYEQRVESTYTFLLRTLELLDTEGVNIQIKRRESIQHYMFNNQLPIEWKLDKDVQYATPFSGYEAGKKTSDVTGQDRLYYDQNKPFEKEIPLYNKYRPSKSVNKPFAYVIPQAYSKVIDRLAWNGVQMKELTEDTEMEVEMYYIDSFSTRKTPYEGHYLHYETTVRKQKMIKQFYKGDMIISMDQAANRFIIETIEPAAPDSYFNWNFFDGILMQKEHFSSYVFEELAAEILKNDESLRNEFAKKKASDKEFASNGYAQLDFIYKRSDYYEKTHNLYPIGRVME